MQVPPEVLNEAARSLSAEEAGAGSALPAVVGPVEGGCIHPAVQLRAPSGRSAFLKWSPDPGPAGFGVEARGLAALARRGGVPIPAVLGVGEGSPEARGWLLLEWIEPGPSQDDTDAVFGRGLGRMHGALTGEAPGWHEEGWIGPLVQRNPAGLDWPDFWASARLEPQWRAARDAGRIGPREEPGMQAALSSIDDALVGWDADGISLLHGDLWSGNVIVDARGRAHLVDPAVYRGHREVDLAMMDLFGGFPARMMHAYEEVAALHPGYQELRRGVYQLYPLLVHVNLFGGGYVARTRSTLMRILAELGISVS